jgi:Zn-dependent alcohol dehydrogenase
MIVAVDTSDDKLELAKQFGATHGFNVTGQENAAKSLFKLTGGGADYAFDCVGAGKISEMAWGVLRRGGTAVIVGIAGPKDQIHLNAQAVATSEKTLTGSY